MIIKTGYYNWHEFGLKETFYPDDMPEEWRLTFYANEIECVQISLGRLNEIKDVEELFEDLNDQFYIVIECDDVNEWPLLQELLENNDINVKALLCSELFMQQWSERISGYPVSCFKSSDKTTVFFEEKYPVKQLVNTELNVIYIDEILNLKQIRQVIEQWVEGGKSNEYYLLFNPSVFKPTLAGEVRLLIEMLGY